MRLSTPSFRTVPGSWWLPLKQLTSSTIAWWLFLILALILFGVEAGYFASPDSLIRGFAGWAWLAISCLVLVIAFLHSFLPFFATEFGASRDRLWYLAAFLFPPLLILFDIQGITYTVLNTESTQQLAAAMEYAHNSRDLGIFNLAFLGYPSRQYLLAALPSLIFGTGLITLRLGYAAFYLIAYLSFLSATWAYLRHWKFKFPLLLASFAGLSVALATFPLLLARIFEQTIIPISVVLLFLAGLLFFLIRPAPIPALWVFWSFGMMPHSYSPTLGFMALAVPLLGYLCFPWDKLRTLTLLGVLAYGAATMASSIAIQGQADVLRGRFTLGGVPNLTVADWLYRYGVGFHAAFGLEESLIPAHLVLGSLIILYASLRQKDFRFLLLVLWSIGVVFFALALQGYCWGVPEWDLHRAMIILPPLSLAVTLYLASYWKAFIPSQYDFAFRGLIIGVLLLLILNAIYLPLIRRGPRGSTIDVINDQEEATLLVVNHSGPPPKLIYVIPDNLVLEDGLQYFSPETKVIHGPPPAGEHSEGAFVLSFIHPDDPESRYWDQFARHTHPRPFLQMKPE